MELLATRVALSYEAAQRYLSPQTSEKSLFPDLAYRTSKSANKNFRDKAVSRVGYSKVE